MKLFLRIGKTWYHAPPWTQNTHSSYTGVRVQGDFGVGANEMQLLAEPEVRFWRIGQWDPSKIPTECPV